MDMESLSFLEEYVRPKSNQNAFTTLIKAKEAPVVCIMIVLRGLTHFLSHGLSESFCIGPLLESYANSRNSERNHIPLFSFCCGYLQVTGFLCENMSIRSMRQCSNTGPVPCPHPIIHVHSQCTLTQGIPTTHTGADW